MHIAFDIDTVNPLQHDSNLKGASPKKLEICESHFLLMNNNVFLTKNSATAVNLQEIRRLCGIYCSFGLAKLHPLLLGHGSRLSRNSTILCYLLKNKTYRSLLKYYSLHYYVYRIIVILTSLIIIMRILFIRLFIVFDFKYKKKTSTLQVIHWKHYIVLRLVKNKSYRSP